MLAPAAVFVAVVASRWAVAVTADSIVNVVGLGLLVRRLRVAVDAGEARVVGRNLVAVVAHRPVVRNREVRVIEHRV